jgi:signal transduction histidine kinase
MGQRQLADAADKLEHEVLTRTAELRAANISLARANLELAEVAKLKEAFVLELSHDLRTPLTSVKGAAENLLDGIAGTLTAAQREYVEIVRHHAERLIGAVSRLLDGARASAPAISVDCQEVDLTALAADVVKSLSPIAKGRGVHVTVTPSAAVSVIGDGAKLRLVFENIVGNALKFTDPGGRVDVEIERRGEAPLVRIRDTGVGIAPEHLGRVFERYYRAEPGSPGSGLGLAITRELVRLHGGEIEVRSTPGAGSEFAVLLPAPSVT